MNVLRVLVLAAVAAIPCVPALAADGDMKPDKAIEKFLKAVEKAPEDADSWFNLGLAYHKAKKYADAEKALRKAVELNPASALNHAWLGTVLVDNKNASEGVKELEAALAIDATLVAARTQLAQAYSDAGRWDDAIAAYKELIKTSPENVNALYAHLGNAYLKKGDEEQAIKWFERTVEKSPNDPTAHYNLAVIYRKVAADSGSPEMWKRTAEQFAKAQAMDPTDLKKMVYAGEALAIAGRTAEALALFDRYLKADPDGAKAGAKANKLAKDLKSELSGG